MLNAWKRTWEDKDPQSGPERSALNETGNSASSGDDAGALHPSHLVSPLLPPIEEPLVIKRARSQEESSDQPASKKPKGVASYPAPEPPLAEIDASTENQILNQLKTGNSNSSTFRNTQFLLTTISYCFYISFAMFIFIIYPPGNIGSFTPFVI
jgi:hypothetical protein